MIRARLFAAALLSTAAAAAPALAGMLPLPRDQVTVTGPEVRLGDLFQNLPAGSGRAVAVAPAPGGRTVIDGSQLAAIAAANGIDWQPRGRLDRVIVEREARTVDAPEIERQLGQAIGGAGRDYAVELENRLTAVRLPIGDEHRIGFESLRIDESGRRVTALLVAPTGDGGSTRTPVAGRLFANVDVPVLRAPVMPGQSIRESDVEWIKLRGDRLRRGTVTDLQYLVGMTPRRPLAPGAPLDMRELQERIVVAKNSLVTVVFRTGALTLTTQGKALEPGAEGAAIRVLNQRSNRTIEATVVAPDLVEVRPAQTLGWSLGRNR